MPLELEIYLVDLLCSGVHKNNPFLSKTQIYMKKITQFHRLRWCSPVKHFALSRRRSRVQIPAGAILTLKDSEVQKISSYYTGLARILGGLSRSSLSCIFQKAYRVKSLVRIGIWIITQAGLYCNIKHTPTEV